MKRVLVVVAIVALVGSTALAVPRTWKSANGKFSTQAELVDFQDGKAHLKKDDGLVVQVPLLSLSLEDRQYVKSQFPGVVEEQFRPGAEYREWKSKSGKYSVLAEFQGYGDGYVQLRKPDGTDISVERKVLSTFTAPDGRIKAFPVQEKKFLVLLRHVLKAFDPGIRYTEKRVNQILAHYSEDTARLRRALVDHNFMAREGGGGKYWRIDG